MKSTKMLALVAGLFVSACSASNPGVETTPFDAGTAGAGGGGAGGAGEGGALTGGSGGGDVPPPPPH